MMIWIVCAVLTAAAFLAALFPYLRTKQPQVQPETSDIAVYKDQLTEIDSDLERGMISKADAENARIEVSRRLLKADEAARSTSANGNRKSALAAGLVLLSIPAISWGGYALVGSPHMPDMPVVARINAAKEGMNEIAGMLRQAEDHLKANPGDGRGWSVIAPIYYRMGRFDDAATAFKNAIANSDPSVPLQMGLGEALAAMNNGLIAGEALAAFRRAAEIDPTNPGPKVMLASALGQQGKLAEAKAAFEQILAEAPKDAPWRGDVEGAVRQIESAMSGQTAPAAKGPTQSDIENAATMSDQDRTVMIEGMVAQLDARLAENPNDPDGWAKLVRSYVIMQNPEKATDALARATKALSGNEAALAKVKAIANELGLKTP